MKVSFSLMLTSALMASFVSSVSHSDSQERETRDQVFERYVTNGFTGTAGVFGAKGDYRAAGGSERDRPLVVSDRFLIGSISKQFTAVAILKLVEKQVVALEDPIAKYIPHFRSAGITLHHLLSQTSGIKEVTATREFAKLKQTRFETLEPLVELISGLERDFEPGEKWAYSNSNYLLLSRVVEVASGESWWSFVKRELLEPAGMAETGYFSDRGPYLVTGHEVNPQGFPVEITETSYLERGWASGAGGMESTIGDLAKWNASLFGGRVVSSRSLELMTRAHGEVADGISYGYGLFIAKDEATGERYFYHPGGIPGFVAYNSYYPLRETSAIALSNLVSPAPIDLARELVNAD